MSFGEFFSSEFIDRMVFVIVFFIDMIVFVNLIIVIVLFCLIIVFIGLVWYM